MQIRIEIAPGLEDTRTAKRIAERFGADPGELLLKLEPEGLCLQFEDQVLRGDYTRMLPRLKGNAAAGELLAKAARIKGAQGFLRAVDATAGLGEDSLVLAAAGFQVDLYERNPVMYELLLDTLERAAQVPELASIVRRMRVHNEDSIRAMESLPEPPDVILLDPMFPERQKSALVKKKLQMIQKLEMPCMDEGALMKAAILAKPRKLVVKRPPKGPYLAGLKPDHSIEGKAVRFDCFVSPCEKIHKYFPEEGTR